ncbi:hypothetical protein E4U11_007392 [Claviceps purpurea]|nr:hypothetical protein E4U11_007392 [Claviceps purpurea]
MVPTSSSPESAAAGPAHPKQTSRTSGRARALGVSNRYKKTKQRLPESRRDGNRLERQHEDSVRWCEGTMNYLVTTARAPTHNRPGSPKKQHARARRYSILAASQVHQPGLRGAELEDMGELGRRTQRLPGKLNQNRRIQ